MFVNNMYISDRINMFFLKRFQAAITIGIVHDIGLVYFILKSDKEPHFQAEKYESEYRYSFHKDPNFSLESRLSESDVPEGDHAFIFNDNKYIYQPGGQGQQKGQ